MRLTYTGSNITKLFQSQETEFIIYKYFRNFSETFHLLSPMEDYARRLRYAFRRTCHILPALSIYLIDKRGVRL